MAPPAMFSTITVWLQVRPSLSASSRATVSVVEPAAAGTTSFTTRDGKASWASAGRGCPAAISAARPSMVARTSDRIVSSEFAAILSPRRPHCHGALSPARQFAMSRATPEARMAYDLEQFCAEARATLQSGDTLEGKLAGISAKLEIGRA